jgi:hypothetical protein
VAIDEHDAVGRLAAQDGPDEADFVQEACKRGPLGGRVLPPVGRVGQQIAGAHEARLFGSVPDRWPWVWHRP